MKCIYTIINLKNGKQYIGSTTNFSRRKQKHLYLLKNNKHHSLSLQHSWNKNNEEDFKFIVVKELNKDEDCYIEEQLFLDKYQTYNKKYGYNMSKNTIAPYGTNNIRSVYQFSLKGKLLNVFDNCVQAGDYIGCSHSGLSKCAREKYRFYKGYIWSYKDKLSQERIELANNPIKRSNEAKLKMSRSAKNRLDNLKPILQYDLNMNFIKEWNSTSELTKEKKYSNGYISDCLHGKHKKAYGYIWKFKI